MLEITSHRNGEILNYKHGRESADSLLIELRGLADPQSRVTVNGMAVARCDREFRAEVPLRSKVNKVTVSAKDKFGERTQTITLVWDKASFKRYTVRIDDNCFFMTDLAREKPARLFDHFYLKGLKELHEKYGSKFILKCFFRNEHDSFSCSIDLECERGVLIACSRSFKEADVVAVEELPSVKADPDGWSDVEDLLMIDRLHYLAVKVAERVMNHLILSFHFIPFDVEASCQIEVVFFSCLI